MYPDLTPEHVRLLAEKAAQALGHAHYQIKQKTIGIIYVLKTQIRLLSQYAKPLSALM